MNTFGPFTGDRANRNHIAEQHDTMLDNIPESVWSCLEKLIYNGTVLMRWTIQPEDDYRQWRMTSVTGDEIAEAETLKECISKAQVFVYTRRTA